MSETRTIVTERNHDYLYDKIYQLSSERDHARATYRANTTSQRIQVVPNYPTMFSDLRHYPRSQIKIVDKDPVPKFINRHSRGFSEQARLMMKNLSKLGDTSSIIARYLPDNADFAEVGGRDRFRYFRRPIIPYASQLPPDVILAVNQSENNYQISEEEVYHPPTRNFGTQTIYRDSDVQTDPYTPEYLVRPGEAPEVLTLASLTCGRGLPAGLHEVEMIDRARHRRELEAQLPPLNDFSESEKRRKMMDAIETEEWAIREREIEELQKLRLEVLVKLLRQREEAYQEMSNQRLDRLWNKKQQEKERLFYNLRLKHVKAIRQILKTRKNIENKHVSRDIIQDYSNSSSQTWAPLTRIGQFLDRNSQQNLVNSRYLTTYSGLMELEESLPDSVLNPSFIIPKQSQYTKAGFKKRKFREQEKLKTLHESIKKTSSSEAKVEKPLQFLQKIEKPIPRPPTPTIEIPDQEEEDKERAIIFLQRIIRGRSIQSMMFEGKQKRTELIEELRSTHSLLNNETEIDKEKRSEVINIQRQRVLLEHREERIDEALSNLEGESMSEMFDFLGKELLRIQEERRIHAFSMLAERERRIREAEQSGLRQLEERRRREHDEIFKQIVKVNQASVDSYLKEIIDSNIDWSASHISKMEIEELAKKINDESYESELVNTRLQQEEVAADLIHNFLIPEVHKRSIQEKIEKNQKKFLYTAHREIFNLTENAVHNTSLRGAEFETEGDYQNNVENTENNETDLSKIEKSLEVDNINGLLTTTNIDDIKEQNNATHEVSTSINEIDNPNIQKIDQTLEDLNGNSIENNSIQEEVNVSNVGQTFNDEENIKYDRNDTHLQIDDEILDDYAEDQITEKDINTDFVENE